MIKKTIYFPKSHKAYYCHLLRLLYFKAQNIYLAYDKRDKRLFVRLSSLEYIELAVVFNK